MAQANASCDSLLPQQVSQPAGMGAESFDTKLNAENIFSSFKLLQDEHWIAGVS